MSAAPAFAGNEINEHRECLADATIRVHNTSGSLRVSAWDKNELAVTGEIGRGVEKVEVDGPPDHLEVRVVLKKLSTGHGDADLTLQLPRGVRLEVETVSADIQARDLTNKLAIESVSGDVEITGRLRELMLRTVSGQLAAKSVVERAILKTVSGDIHLSDVSGELELETVSGGIRLSGEGFSRLRVKSVSGDIEISGELRKDSTVDLESHSGDIVFELPGNTSASFEMSSFSGDISSDLGEKVARDRDACDDEERHGPGHKLRFTTGAPGSAARVAIKTFSGDVQIKKR